MGSVVSSILQIVEGFPVGEEFTAPQVIDRMIADNPRLRRDSLRHKVPSILEGLIHYGLVERTAEHFGSSPAIWRRV